MNIQFALGTAYQRFELDPTWPTIVFLHDSLGCIELWRSFPYELGKLSSCNVMVYDRMGYGKASEFESTDRGLNYMELEADKLIDLLNYWELEKAILFGHSDGGSIAIIAAGKYPERISAIITEGAHVFVEDITLAGIEDAIKVFKTTELPAKLEKYHGTKTQKMFEAWSITWTKPFFKDWNIEAFLKTLECPSLIIQGEQDEYGSLKQVESIVTKSKGLSTSLVLPNVRHTPHKECPEIVLSAVEEFITSNLVLN